MTSTSYLSSGRANQKIRTRAAIKAAAAEIIERGEEIDMATVAEEALISRSTVYRYFPSQEALVAEIMLDKTVALGLAEVYEAAETPGTAEERLDAVVRSDHKLVVENQRAFRTAIVAMLTSHPDDASRLPRRPGNRLRYLAEALAPVADRLGPERLERLVMALTLFVGTESVVVLEDICGLSPDEAEALKLWATGALLQAALDESGADGAER